MQLFDQMNYQEVGSIFAGHLSFFNLFTRRSFATIKPAIAKTQTVQRHIIFAGKEEV